MPIRFRCPNCRRLLGIASRKAGTATTCPQCGQGLVVPMQSEEITSGQPSEGQVKPVSVGKVQASKWESRRFPGVPVAKVVKGVPREQRPNLEDQDEPLFIGEDIDKLLGLTQPPKEVLLPKAGPQPVSGMDVLAIEDEQPGLVSRQNLTLLIVAGVLLMLLSFSIGFLVGITLMKS